MLKKIICFFLLPLQLFAQNSEIDSFKSIVDTNSSTLDAKAEAANYLSYYYISISIPKAKEYAKQAMEFAKAGGDNYQLGKAHYNLGYCYLYSNKPVEALQEFLEVKQIGDKKNRPELLGDAYEAIGELYSKLNYHNKAYYYYTLSLNVAKKLNDTSGMAYSYNSIGIAFRDLNKHDSSLKVLNKSLQFFTQLKASKEQIAFVHAEIGKTYIRLLQKDSARYHLNIAENILVNSPFLLELGQTYLVEGYTYYLSNDFDSASKYINLASTVAKQIDDEIFSADVNAGIGDLYLKREGKSDSAKFYYVKALAIYSKYGKKKKLLNTYSHLVKVAYKLDDRVFFDNLTVKYWQYLMQPYEDSVAAEVENILVDFDTKEKEKEYQILKERNQLQSQQLLIFTIIAIGALLVLVWLFYLYKQRSQALQTEKMQADALLQSNLMLEKTNEVKNKIFSVISHDLRAPLTSAYQMFDLLNNGLIDKEEFSIFSVQMQNELHNSLHLTDNLLHWAKGQSSQINSIITTVQLYPLLIESTQTLQSFISSKHLTINTQLTNWEIETDANMLQIIIRNVLSNAIKFSAEGKTISITYKTEQQKKWLIISDEGVGISDENIAKLKQQNLNSTLGTANEKGAGIGMRLVFDMAAILKKQILINSQLGKGTLVQIEL